MEKNYMAKEDSFVKRTKHIAHVINFGIRNVKFLRYIITLYNK